MNVESYIIFYGTSVFPCQYYSTIAPYSSIHLPPTLYNVFLPAFQFPLSVSFHHCSEEQYQQYQYCGNLKYCNKTSSSCTKTGYFASHRGEIKSILTCNCTSSQHETQATSSAASELHSFQSLPPLTHNNPEERSSQPLHGRSLKSRSAACQ